MIYPDQERKVCPKCMDKKSILLRVMAYFIPYKKSLYHNDIVLYLGTAALNLIWPYLNGTILYDKVLAKDEEFLAFCIFQRDVFVTTLLFLVLAMLLTKISIQAIEFCRVFSQQKLHQKW